MIIYSFFLIRVYILCHTNNNNNMHLFDTDARKGQLSHAVQKICLLIFVRREWIDILLFDSANGNRNERTAEWALKSIFTQVSV